MQKREWMNGKNLAAWAGLSLLFVVTRALLVLPWMLITVPRNDGLTTVLRCAATLLIWVFAVLPEHRFHCWAIMRLNGDDGSKYSYFQAILYGLRRFLHVSYAAVPAVALALLFYYTMTSNLGSLKILKNIGNVLTVFGIKTHGYDAGLGIIIGGLIVFLIVLAVRWYRHTPSDYLGGAGPLRKAPFDRLTVRNFLLAAVAYVLWAVILILFMKSSVSGVSGLMRKASKAVEAMHGMLTRREFRLEMGLVLVLVYCPLWCVRKYGAAKAAARMRDAA